MELSGIGGLGGRSHPDSRADARHGETGAVDAKPAAANAFFQEEDRIQIDPLKGACPAGKMDAGGQPELGFFHATDRRLLMEPSYGLENIQRAEDPAFGHF